MKGEGKKGTHELYVLHFKSKARKGERVRQPQPGWLNHRKRIVPKLWSRSLTKVPRRSFLLGALREGAVRDGCVPGLSSGCIHSCLLPVSVHMWFSLKPPTEGHILNLGGGGGGAQITYGRHQAENPVSHDLHFIYLLYWGIFKH